MSKQMTKDTVELIFKVDDMPKRDFNKVVPSFYHGYSDLPHAIDLIESMLKWNPKERISAAEAAKHPFFAR